MIYHKMSIDAVFLPPALFLGSGGQMVAWLMVRKERDVPLALSIGFF